MNHCIVSAAAYGAILIPPANAVTSSSNIQITIPSPTSPTITTAEYKPTIFQESISGFVSGSAVSTVKTLIKYPLDTATVRLQMPNTSYSIGNLAALFSGSLDGVTAPLISNIPAGAIFFAVKDATKTSLKESGLGLPKWLLTTLAVTAALPPYWLIRNPSEVVKTRLQVGADGYYEGMSTLDAFRLALSNGGNSTSDGIGELYQGYAENVLYGLPADVIKFVAYDYLSGGRGKNNVPPAEGAVYGAISTAFAQLLTTPLDVIRNRIMAEVPTDGNAGRKGNGLSYIDRLSKVAEEEGVQALFAGSWPRISKSILSGAIQFATYEETKQKMSQLFSTRS